MLFEVMNLPVPPQPKRALPPEFASKIQQAREAKGWTQAQLADAVGVSRETVLRIEAGRCPSAHVLDALLRPEALGLSLEGWEGADPFSPGRGHLAYLARRASGAGLATVAAAANISIASLSLFERFGAVPFELVGDPETDDGFRIINDAFATALGFKGASDMTDYLQGDDRRSRLERIAKKAGRSLPAALLPYDRVT